MNARDYERDVSEHKDGYLSQPLLMLDYESAKLRLSLFRKVAESSAHIRIVGVTTLLGDAMRKKE